MLLLQDLFLYAIIHTYKIIENVTYFPITLFTLAMLLKSLAYVHDAYPLSPDFHLIVCYEMAIFLFGLSVRLSVGSF